MAQRRMFSMKIVDTDAFLDMPLSTQALYFHLSMRADDDGFVSNPKRIMRLIGCNDDDMRVLQGKNFIIPFDTGICVIKHWKIHNYIQTDRYHETTYLEEKEQLYTKENGSYTLENPNLDTKCIQNVYAGKVRDSIELDKVSIDKNSKDKETITTVINAYAIDDLELKETLLEFSKHRTKLKKPMTTRSMKLLLTELDKWYLDSYSKIEALNKSIMNGWLSVYEPKKNKDKQNEQSGFLF